MSVTIIEDRWSGTAELIRPGSAMLCSVKSQGGLSMNDKLEPETRIIGCASGDLAWVRRGDPGDPTVIGLHGTPGGRHTAVPPAEVLSGLRLQYLTFDRPGYGLSTRAPGRSVASVAENVRAVADAAGVDRFAVIGGSGGSAHAPVRPRCCRTGSFQSRSSYRRRLGLAIRRWAT